MKRQSSTQVNRGQLIIEGTKKMQYLGVGKICTHRDTKNSGCKIRRIDTLGILLGLLLSLFCLVFFAAPAFGAGEEYSWVFTDDPTTPPDQLNFDGNENTDASVLDSSGNLILTGYADGDGTLDYYTVKISGADGAVLWRRTFNGAANGDDWASSIAVDSQDNIIVTGHSYTAHSLSSDNDDIVTIKYDRDGNEVWAAPHIYNGTENDYDYPTAIAIDRNDNIYIAGYTNSGAIAGQNALLFRLNSGGPNPDGDPIWTFVGDYPLDDRFTSVTAGPSEIEQSQDVILVTGFVKKCQVNCDDNTTANDVNGSDYLTMKFDWLKNEIWRAVYDSSQAGDIFEVNDESRVIALDSNGDVIVSGTVEKPGSRVDAVTLKYSAAGAGDGNGTIIWQSSTSHLTANNHTEPRGIVIDSTNKIFMTGYTFTNANMDDFYTARLNSDNGNVVWEDIFDNPYETGDTYDAAAAIATDDTGGVYVTGSSFKYIGESYDFLTVKYHKESGNVLWSSTYNGDTGGDDQPVSIAVALGVDHNGDIFVGGYSEYTDANGTELDFCAIKYDGGILEKPTGLVSTVNPQDDTQIDLIWEDNADLPNNEDYYCVERCEGWGCIDFTGFLDCTVPADSTTYSDSGLTRGTWYTYRVKAMKSDGPEYSKDSNTASSLALTIHYPAPTWYFMKDGTGLDDIAYAVAAGPDNNPVAVGMVSGVSTQNDYYTVKLDRLNPNPLKWEAYFNDGDSAGDVGKGITVDSNNDVVVSGFASLDSGVGENTNDIYTMKYEGEDGPEVGPDGYSAVPLWAEQYAGPGADDDRSETVAAMKDGSNNIVVIGYGKKGLAGDDIYVIKYAGNCASAPCDQLIWAADPYDGGSNDYPTSLALTPNMDIVVGGEVNKTFDPNGEPATSDVFVSKYNGTDGSIMPGWPVIFDGQHGVDGINDVAVDRDGNIYAAGYVVSSSGDLDWYINKFSSSGEPQWGVNGTRVAGAGGGYDEAVAIEVDQNDGNIVVGGTVTGQTGSPDFKVIRYTPDGVILWQEDLDRHDNDDYAVSMAISPSGDICLSGETTDNNGLTFDIMAILYDHRDGTLLGSTIYDSTYDDYSTGTTTNNLGEFFISGYSGDAEGSGKDWDFLVVKLEAGAILQAPAPFTATAHQSSIDLNWTENDPTASGYRVMFQPGNCNPGGGTLDESDIINAPLPGQTTYTIKNLGTNYESFCVGIRSYKISTGEVSAIIERQVTTVPPSPPDNLVASLENTTSIKLCWDDNTPNEEAFTLQRCTGINCTFDQYNPQEDLVEFVLPGGEESTYCFIDETACDSGKGNGNGKTFSYQVQAVSNSDQWHSAWADPSVNSTTPALGQPTNFVALTENDSEITLQWNDNSIDEDGYWIRRCDGTAASCTPFPGTPDQEFSIDTVSLDPALLLEMEEASWDGTPGGVADSSGFGNDATAYNGANTLFDNDRGQVAKFDGINDYLQTPLSVDQSDNSTGVTIMAWVKKEATLDYRYIFSTESIASGRQYDWGLWVYNSTWYVDNGSTTLNAGNTFVGGQWQHVAVVFDPAAAEIELFVNGNSVKTMAIGTFTADTSSPLTFGRRGAEAAEYWNGLIDESAVFEKPLTGAEIMNIFNHGVSFPGTGRYTDKSVSPDANYTYQVVGHKATACGSEEVSLSSVSLETSTAPDPPSNFVAVAGDSSTVYLSWLPKTTSQIAFQLERCEGNLTTCTVDGDFTDVISSTIPSDATSYGDDSVCLGTQVYRLKALGNWPNSGGSTAFSNYAEVTVEAAPGLASLSVAGTSEEEVALTWTMDGTDWQSFEVLRCDGSAPECTNDGNYTAVPGSPVSPYLSGLVGLWRMDEYSWDDNASSSEVLDSSGNGNHGNGVNGPLVSPASKYGYGAGLFSFDEAIATPVSIDQSVSSPGATFEAWVYVSSGTSSYQAIVSTNNGGGDWAVYLNSNTIYIYDGSSRVSTGQTISYNSWNHIVAAYVPGLGVNVYVNGNKKTLYNISYDSSSGNVYVGSNPGTGDYFRGLIDEVAIYNRPLTDEEVSARRLNRYSYSQNGLAEGDYTYRVKPYKSAICSDWASHISYSQVSATIGFPQSPSGFSAEPVDTTTIDLAWTNETTSETTLRLARCVGDDIVCDDYGTDFTDIASALPAGTESYSDNTICEGVEYTYWLRAEKSGSPAGWPTAWAKVTRTGLDAKASALNISILSESEADVSWSDNGTDEEQFVLSRCQGAGCSPVSPADDILVVPGTPVGRVLHYRLDEDDWAGGAVDASGMGNGGTVAGVTLVDDPVRGRVANFDGYDYIATPLNIEQTEVSSGMTVEAWVRPTYSDSSWDFVFSSDNGGSDWALMHYSGTWRVYNGTSYWSTGIPVDLNSWQHVAVSFTPFQGVKFYKNGSEYVNTTISYDASTANIIIGNNSIGGSNNFVGMIDELIIHDHPLSAAEIVRNASAPYTWTYQNVGLTPGEEYTFKLDTQKTGWCAPVVSQKTITMLQPPAPENLQVIPNTTGFHLIWEDKAGAETGFTLRRCAGNAAACDDPDDNATKFTQEFQLDGADIQEFVDSDICVGTDYTYAVRDKKDAPNGWVTSWNTNGPVTATLATPLIPSITSALQVNEVQIDLEWDNANLDETGYTIEQCNPAEGCKTIAKDADVTLYQPFELKPNTCYTFRVRAEKEGSACSSIWPTDWSDNATVCTYPLAPGTIDANPIDTTTIGLAWTDMTETETGTVIERCYGDLAYCCDGNATNCVDQNFVEAGRVGPGQTSFIDAITPELEGENCYNQEYHYRLRSLGEGLSNNGGGSWALRAPVLFGNVFQPHTGIEIVVPIQPEMNPDLSDIRFYDDVAKRELMAFWIREKTVDSATVWLMTGDNQEIFLYYGNPDAGDASGSDDDFTTVYDNFQGTTIDPEKWIEFDTGAYVTQNNGLQINHDLTLWSGVVSTEVFGRAAGSEITVEFSLSYYYNHKRHEGVFGWGMDQSSAASNSQMMHGIYMYTQANQAGTSRFRPIENGGLTEPSPGRYYDDGVGNYAAKIVLKEAGADYYIRGGIFTDWTLLYDEAVTPHTGDESLRLTLAQKTGYTNYKYISVKQVTTQLLASVDFDSAATPPALENIWIGGYSTAASASTFDIGTVSDLQVEPGMEGQVVLSWTANGVEDEDGYLIERCYGSACTSFVNIGYADAAATSFVDSNVDGSSFATYRVMAYKDGSCPWTGPEAVGPEIETPPLAQFGLQATVRNAFAVELFWDDNNTDGDHFELETQIFNGRWVSIGIVDDNVTSYLDTSGVNPNSEYTYRVRALKGTAQSSVYSNEVTVRTGPFVDGNSTTTCVVPSP